MEQMIATMRSSLELNTKQDKKQNGIYKCVKRETNTVLTYNDTKCNYNYPGRKFTVVTTAVV